MVVHLILSSFEPQVGTAACTAAVQAVELSVLSKWYSKTFTVEETKSTYSFLHLYRNRWQTLWQEGAMEFGALHISFAKVIEIEQ